jgi:hypothetical protein
MAGSLRTFAYAAFALAGAATALAFLATEAEATHMRGGTIYATTDDPVGAPLAARIHVVQFARASFFGVPPPPVASLGWVCFGDGACSSGHVSVLAGYDPFLDLAVYEADVPHTYAHAGPWNYWASTCCLGGFGDAHFNNPNAMYRIDGVVTLPATQPYKADLRPVTYCPVQGCSLDLTPSNGAAATVRLSTAAETGNGAWYQPGPCGGCGSPATSAWVTQCPPALNWIPGSGAATVAPPGNAYYSVHVQIEGAGGDRSSALWLIDLNKPISDTGPNPPPAVPPPQPAHTHSIAFATPGTSTNLHWDVHAATASEDPAASVEVTAQVCQQGGSCIQRTATTDSAGKAHFHWPGQAPSGTYTLCVTDMAGPGWVWDDAAGHAAAGNCRTDTT